MFIRFRCAVFKVRLAVLTAFLPRGTVSLSGSVPPGSWAEVAWTFTVSDLNEYVARSLASDPMLRDIRVTGEISNFKAHSSGHWYFDLKDERGRMSCVMYRQNHLRLAAPAEGERVILSGAPGLYAVTGRYQFYAQGMEKDGQGELYKKYLLLKEQLLKEGCFDAARKKPLPLFPRVVGVVTSRTGAVIRRCSWCCARPKYRAKAPPRISPRA